MKSLKKISTYLSKKKWYAILIGALALIWFLIRVIPKPQRASYPCQRAAFPLASAFVIWIIGIFSSKSIYNKAKQAFRNKNLIRAGILTSIALMVFVVSAIFSQVYETTAAGIGHLKLKNTGTELYRNQMNNISEDIVNPQAFVGIVKSDKADAYNIEFDELNKMVREAVSLAGGFDTLIHEGDTVVLKPNVISSRTETGVLFPETGNGIATDYRIIQIVANMVREKNSSGKIFIIEASGNGVTRSNIEELGYEKITGIDSIILLDEFEGDWYDRSDTNLVEVNLPEGKHLYSNENKYYLNKVYKNAQVVISLPCLKTHGLTGITGSVKNVGIGATPVQIYGNGPNFPDIVKSARWDIIDHGNGSNRISLENWIHDFYLCKPVDYVIMDGLQGAEFGPYPGGMTGANVALSSVQHNMGLILAGKDPIAVDAIHALTVGMDPFLIGHLQFLAEHEMGCVNPIFIKVKGAQIHNNKKSFNEIFPGNLKKYSDFKAPVIDLPQPGTIENNILNFNLQENDEIVKVEIAYNDTVLPFIIIDNFTSISINLESWQTDISKVKVYAYDKYLNCSSFTPDQVIISNKRKQLNPLKVYPIPAKNYLNIDCSSIDNDLTILIFNHSGQLLKTEKIATLNNDLYKLDIRSLKPGNYILQANTAHKSFSAKFAKTLY